MSASVLVCGALFDGVSAELAGRTEIAVRDEMIVEIGSAVDRPEDAELIDLSEYTVSPGFIDTHVHLTVDAANPRPRIPQLRLHHAARRRLGVKARRGSTTTTTNPDGGRRGQSNGRPPSTSRPSSRRAFGVRAALAWDTKTSWS